MPTTSLTAQLSDDGVSYSVEDQEVRCRALADANGYTIVDTFLDDGISAYRSSKGRPGYADLRKAIQAKQFDVLVFDRQDRLQRDQVETMDFMVLSARAGIRWHSVDEGLIDLNDTMGLLVTMLRGGQAQDYSSKISINSRKANQSKRDKGLPGAGQRPFGFKVDKITHERAEAKLIKTGTKMILDGASRWQVLELFRSSGLKSVRGRDWHVASVIAILKRWRNAGWVEHAGEPYIQAIWKPIVTLEDVRNVRSILGAGKVPGRWKQPAHLASGIATCHCGYTLVASGTSRPGEIFYRCSGIVRNGFNDRSMKHVQISKKVLDPAIRAAIVEQYLAFPQRNDAQSAENQMLADLYEKLATVNGGIERLAEALALDMPTAIWSKENAKLIADRDTIQGQINQLAASSAHAAMLIEARRELFEANTVHDGDYTYVLLEQAQSDKLRQELPERFDELPLESQRRLASALQVVVRPGRGKDRIAIDEERRAAALSRAIANGSIIVGEEAEARFDEYQASLTR